MHLEFEFVVAVECSEPVVLVVAVAARSYLGDYMRLVMRVGYMSRRSLTSVRLGEGHRLRAARRRCGRH